MRLDRRNRALAGRTVVSVDGVPLASLSGVTTGNPQPFSLDDQDALICNALIGGAWCLVAAPLAGGPYRAVDSQGANRLGASGPFWVAQTATGYRDVRGLSRADWSLLAVDDLTAHVALAVRIGDQYQLAVWDGQTLNVIEPDGADSWEDGEISFRDGLLAYRKHGEVRTDPPQAIAQVPGQGVRYARGYLTQWQDGRGLSIRRAGETRGIVISADGRDFGHDMRVQDDGLILVVSSSGEGEMPGELRRYLVNPVLGTVNGEARPWVDLLAPVAPDLGRFDHPIWIAPFKAWNDRADYGKTETPTNAMVLDLADPSTAPSRYAFLWEGVPTTPETPSRSLDSRFIGYYLSCEGGGSNPDVRTAFERAVPRVTAAAIARQRPVYVTLDGVVDPDRWLAFLAQYFPARAGLEVVPMPELYPIVGLSEDAIVRAWDRLLGTLAARGYRLAAATTLYTQSDFWPLSLIRALQRPIADLVRKFRLMLVAPFSVGRPSGVVSYPDVLGPILAQWGSAAPAGVKPPWLVLPTSSTPSPAPAPPSHHFQELLMSGLTLKRSQFREGSFAADRGGKLYPDLSTPSRNLSIDVATGEPRRGGLPNNGPSETFFLGADRATVDFGTHAYSFLLID
jgi:hypothetical protein